MFGRAAGLRRKRLLTVAAGVVFCCALESISEVLAEDNPSFRQRGDYDKWSLFCTQSPSSSSDCALVQAAQDEADEKTKLRMSISFDDKWDLIFKLRVEPRPVQSEGVALLIDGIQDAVIQPGNCDPNGCSASFHPSTVMLARALHGSELEGQFRTQPRTGVSLGLDLPGLRDGLMAMRDELPSRSGGDDWVASSPNSAVSEFKVALLSLKDLPQDKIMDVQSIRTATTLPSPLIGCRSDGIQVGEQRPNPISFSVDGRLEVVNHTDVSGSNLRKMADVLRRCGNEYVAIILPDSSSSRSPTLFQIQQATVEDIIEDEGIGKDRLVVADWKAGLLLQQHSQRYVGAWQPSPGK
jgi:invasion protein IalB